MTWNTILNYLADNWLEIAGTITTILGIWLTTRRLLVCWPVVLAADFLYLVVFYRARLFSDSLLQVFFVAFTLYGWWHWWRGVQEDGEVRVEPLSRRGWLGGLAAGAVGSLLLGWLMTKSARPCLTSMPPSPATRSSPVGGKPASTSPTGGSGSPSTSSTSANISTRI